MVKAKIGSALSRLPYFQHEVINSLLISKALVLNIVTIRWRVSQRLMWALVIVKGQVLINASLSLTRRSVIVQVNFFEFDRAPEAYGEVVFCDLPLSIHANLNTFC